MANTRFVTENGLYVTSGNSQFDQTAQFNANLTVSGDLLFVGGNLYVQGTQVIIGGQEYATDLLATIPNLKLGNTTYQWDAYLDNTLVYGDLIPVGNTVLLGNSTNRWVISGNTLNISTTSTLTGAVTLSNTISVTGNATFSNSLAATGNVVLSNTINVTGAATLSNTINVTGAATLGNTLSVTNTATLSNTLNVTGATTLSNTINVTGAATLGNTLSVTNTATFSNTVVITGAANVLSTLGIGGAANALSTLGVTGAATLSNTINVTGAATLGNTLSVTNTATFSNTVNITGAATLSNTINVTGAATLGNTLSVTNTATLSNTLNVTGATTLSNTINVTGAATLGNTLSVTNTATFSNTVNITGAATLSNTLGVTGATTLSNTLGLTGAATFSNTLAVTGATTLANTLAVSGNSNFRSGLLFIDASNSRVGIGNGAPDTGLTIGFAANIAGPVQMSNTLGVTGAATLGNTLSVTNTATFSNTLNVTGAVTLSNTIGVTGAATLSNTLGVTGAATLSNTINVTGAATLGNTLSVTNTATLSNTLNVTGAVTLSNTLGVTGAATLANTIAVTGNATFSKDVLISGNLIVSGTTTYVNTATLNIADNIITLNADVPAITAPTENAGIEINRGSSANVTLRWNETNDYWEATEDGTNYYRLAVQGAGNTSFDSGVLFVDAVNNRVGINNTAPGVALRVTGAADISSTANVQGNANVGGTLGVTGATTLASTLSVTGAANALSTLGVNGATTLAGTLAVTGNSTFSANARIEGRLTVNTGGISFGYTAYPIYQTNLDFGADVAGTWRKIASVSLQNAQYSTAGYRIQLVVTNANHATLQSARDAEEMVYYVACNRSNDTVLDTPDACYVYGPSDHVRAVKTSTGNYEIQVQNKFQYVEYQVVIQCYIQNGNANAATFFDGSTAGSAGVAQYNATSSSNNAVWVQVLRVGNSTTNSLVNSSSLSIPSVFTTNSTITNAAANVQLTPSATAGYVGIGRAPTATVKLAVNSQFSTDGSTIGAYNDYSIANTALTAARTYQGLNTQFTNRGQQKDSGGTTTYNSTGYGVFATAYNGDPTTGGDAQLYDIYGAYVTARNYANGSSANTVTVGYGLSSLYNSSGNGVTTTAFGVRSEVAAANSSITGNIATAYGVRSVITSNTSMTITDGFLFSGTFNGSTTTNKFGVYLTGESNNYFSSNVYVGNVLTTIGLANLAGNLNTPTVNATSNLNIGIYGTTNGAVFTNTQITIGNTTGYALIGTTATGGSITLQSQVGNTFSNATVQLSIQNGNSASIELGGTTNAFIDFKTPFADDYDTRLLSNTTGFYIIGGSATSANLVEIQSANVNIDSGVLYVDATNNRVGVNTTTPGVPFEVKGGGGTTSALSLVHPTDLSFVRIVPSASAGAYNPTVAVGDHLLYFSNGTSNYGNLVIAPWSSVSFGMKFNTIGNTITLTANSINMDSGVLYVDGLNNRVGINNTAPGVALRVTGDADVSATANIQGVLHARSGAISYSQLTIPGSSSSTGEGGQIILGYGNNLASTITGQQNYTYNIDVVGGNTGSTPIMRILAQHGDGTTTGIASFANTGRIHLGATAEQTETTVKITGTANVTQLLNASGNLNAPVVNASSNLNVGTFGTTSGVNVQNTFMVVGNTVAYVNTSYGYVSVVNATATTNVLPTAVVTPTVNATSNLNVGAFGTTSGVNVQNTVIVVGNSTANAVYSYNLIQTSNSTGIANLTPVVLAIGSSNVNPTWVTTPTVNATSNLNVGTFGTTSGVNVQNTVIVVGNSTANATYSYNLLQTANSTGIANLTPVVLAIGSSNVNPTWVTTPTVNATSNLNVGTFGTTNGVNITNSSLLIGNTTGNAVINSNSITIRSPTSQIAAIYPTNINVQNTTHSTTIAIGSITACTQSPTTPIATMNWTSFGVTSGDGTYYTSLNESNVFVGISDGLGGYSSKSIVSYNYISSANTTTTANLIPSGLVVGTTSVNGSLINAAAINVVNQTNTATLYVTTSANVGTALTVNSTVINAAANIAMAAYTEKMASYTIVANGTQDLDLKLASIFKVSVGAFTANVRFINPPASGTGVSATLILQYTGTSVLTLQGNTAAGAAGTLKYSYDTAPTLTQTNLKSDILSVITYDGGATYIVSPSFMNFTT